MVLLNALIAGLFATAAVVLALGMVVVLPRRLSCPRCHTRTTPLKGRLPRAAQLVQRRWCTECGWSGLSRRPDKRREWNPQFEEMDRILKDVGPEPLPDADRFRFGTRTDLWVPRFEWRESSEKRRSRRG